MPKEFHEHSGFLELKVIFRWGKLTEHLFQLMTGTAVNGEVDGCSGEVPLLRHEDVVLGALPFHLYAMRAHGEGVTDAGGKKIPSPACASGIVVVLPFSSSSKAVSSSGKLCLVAMEWNRPIPASRMSKLTKPDVTVNRMEQRSACE